MNESIQELVRKVGKPAGYAAVAVLVILALYLLVLTVNAFGNIGRSTNPYMNTITVEGKGTAASIPDLAVVTFTVTEQAATVAKAQEAATAKTDAALEAVDGLEIEERDVKTIAYNVSPRYENPGCYAGYCPPNTNRIVGYEVSQTVEVKVRDTAKAGDLLQALGTLGVQNIQGPNFTVDEDEDVRSAAREEAIDNAKAKARALAKQLGVRLGKVVSFYETNYPYPMYGLGGGMDAVAERAAAPSLPVGEQETEVTVSITYEIR